MFCPAFSPDRPFFPFRGSGWSDGRCARRLPVRVGPTFRKPLFWLLRPLPGPTHCAGARPGGHGCRTLPSGTERCSSSSTSASRRKLRHGSRPWSGATSASTSRRARASYPEFRIRHNLPRPRCAVFVKVVVACIRFHAARLAGPAMGSPPPASWGSAAAPPWPLRPVSGRSGLSQTAPTGLQLRVWPDQRSGRAARASW